MVKEIAQTSGKKITELKCLAQAVKMGSKMPEELHWSFLHLSEVP